MLRNRSRAVTSKQQALMAPDHSSQPSPTQNYKKTSPSFFGSPKFKAFTKRDFFENDGLVSPTSILDTKPFSPLSNLFSYSMNQATIAPKIFPGNKHSWERTEAKGISLVLIDPISNEKTTIKDNLPKSCNRKVVLGTKLRVQIPSLLSYSPTDQSPKSPAEFGVKTRNSYVSAGGSANSCSQTKDISPKAITGSWVSVSDVENSEDYTCVISHGPVPRTTHIFENCIVESYYSLSDHKSNSSPDHSNFLSFCYTCKKNLEQKIDIYIYR